MYSEKVSDAIAAAVAAIPTTTISVEELVGLARKAGPEWEITEDANQFRVLHRTVDRPAQTRRNWRGQEEVIRPALERVWQMTLPKGGEIRITWQHGTLDQATGEVVLDGLSGREVGGADGDTFLALWLMPEPERRVKLVEDVVEVPLPGGFSFYLNDAYAGGLVAPICLKSEVLGYAERYRQELEALLKQ